MKLPGSFLHTGNLALVGQFTEANTADAIFSQISMRPTADFTAVIMSGAELRRSLLFVNHRFFSHDSPPSQSELTGRRRERPLM